MKDEELKLVKDYFIIRQQRYDLEVKREQIEKEIRQVINDLNAARNALGRLVGTNVKDRLLMTEDKTILIQQQDSKALLVVFKKDGTKDFSEHTNQ